MKHIKVVCFLTAYILFVLLLSGCPNQPSSDYVGMIKENMENGYGLRFDTADLPTVDIAYTMPEGTEKTAEFKLDGYDSEKEIGYKIVTLDDKEKWEQERLNGDSQAPDLNDADLIQEEATKYEFPVVFICIYDYQNDSNWDQIIENQETISNELYEIMNTQALKQWEKE